MKFLSGIMVILLAFSLLIFGCVTPEPTVKEVGAVMATGLNAVMNLNMTKAEMLEQAGPPMEKAPLDNGGELWVYVYQKQKSTTIPDQIVTVGKKTYNLGGGRTETHDYAMKVNIKFNQAGRMIGWGYDGNLAVFPDNPFTKLTPPSRSAPKTVSTAGPSESVVDQRRQKGEKLRAQMSDALFRKGKVSQRQVLLQAGVPDEISERMDQKQGISYVYKYSRPADASGGPYFFHLRLNFDEGLKLNGLKAEGQPWVLEGTPFEGFNPTDPDQPPGQWISDPSSRVKAIFDAFPSGYSVKWEGGSVPMPNGERLAEGKGIMRIVDPSGKELGAYVGQFRAGVPAGDIRLIKADPASPIIEGLALGGVPWR